MKSLKEDITPNCDWNSELLFINSVGEKSRAYNQNKNLIIAKYPLTKEYLQNYYNASRQYLKNFYPDGTCAAQCYSFFVQSFGTPLQTEPGNGGANEAGKGSEGSLGLNPFFGFKLFDMPAWLWLVFLIGGFALYESKKS